MLENLSQSSKTLERCGKPSQGRRKDGATDSTDSGKWTTAINYLKQIWEVWTWWYRCIILSLEAEEGGLRVQGQSKLQSNTLVFKKFCFVGFTFFKKQQQQKTFLSTYLLIKGSRAYYYYHQTPLEERSSTRYNTRDKSESTERVPPKS